jgi:hypothetical protein
MKNSKTLKKDKIIREAFDLAEFLAMSKDEQFAYQMDLKTRLDNKNALDYAEEKGIKKVAKNLLQQNVDINLIIKPVLSFPRSSVGTRVVNGSALKSGNTDVKIILYYFQFIFK